MPIKVVRTVGDQEVVDAADIFPGARPLTIAFRQGIEAGHLDAAEYKHVVLALPIFFADTRPLAEEWAYRYLGAALAELR